jgi:hypothetical protein
MNSANDILDKIADEQGWTEATKLILCKEFIDKQGDQDDFEAFLKERAVSENELSEDEENQFKECPECEGHMEPRIGTRYQMTGNQGDDDTTLIEYWECIDCGYTE